jgi:flagellar basal-body rod modification protein FlgD
MINSVENYPDIWLRLFLAQLKNQNPLNPFDVSELTNQLAQFSQMEQLYHVSKKLEELRETSRTSLLGSLLNLIGKEVKAESSFLWFDGEQSTPIEVQLPEGTKEVTLRVFDKSLFPVRVLKFYPFDSSLIIRWDGTDSWGRKLEPGLYHFTLEGIDQKGQAMDLKGYIWGRVSALEQEGGQFYVSLGGLILPLSSIFSINP